MTIRTFISSIVLFFVTTFPMLVAADIDIAVIAPRGSAKTLKRWADLGNYLSAELGETVIITPLRTAQIMSAAEDGDVDFIFSHSAHTVSVLEKFDGELLATVNTKVGPRFGGVIVTRKGSGILNAGDLIGKDVVSLKFRSAAGAYIFQTFELQKQGINPHTDFASIKEGRQQDQLVYSVRDRKADAAFVRTGLLEAMVREGKIKMDDFAVVNQRYEAGFPLHLSTDLYSEWCVTVLPHVSGKLSREIKSALLRIQPDMKVAKSARITGFVEPVSLSNIRSALKALKISPYVN